MGNHSSCNCIDTKNGSQNEISINNSETTYKNTLKDTLPNAKSGAKHNKVCFSFNRPCPGVEVKENEDILNKELDIIKEVETRIGRLNFSVLNSHDEDLKFCSLLYLDNSIYIGTFNSNWEKEGHGTLYLPDGSKFTGEFKNDKINGYGRLIYSTGDYYEGNYVDGVPNDYGIYDSGEGTVYKGNWVDEFKEGHGEENYPDGSKYVGEFHKDSKHGKGKFEWADGKIYEGSIINHDLEGFGRMIKPDGKIYLGDWSKNKMQGKGIFYWDDNKRYAGSYVNNKKQGFGILIWDKDTFYKGYWINGKQHGHGMISRNELSEWRYGKKIRTISNDSPIYLDLISDINSQTEEVNELCREFGIEDITEERLKDLILSYKI